MVAALKALTDAGWTVEPSKGEGHAAYIAKCPDGCCHKSINGTPKSPTGAARGMLRWPGNGTPKSPTGAARGMLRWPGKCENGTN
jgi:hypothetical protein